MQKLLKYWLCPLMVSIGITLIGNPVLAATNEELIEIEEEVVVTATRISAKESEAPGFTEVINQPELSTAKAQTLAEALSNQYGGLISSYGGYAGLASLRVDGSAAEQTLVLLNGIPVNTGCTGYGDISYLPVSSIEKLEITHGPLSSLYGANALGGVVNIFTDLTGKPTTMVKGSYGGFQTTTAELKLVRPKFGLVAGGGWSTGHRANSETQREYLLGEYAFWEDQVDYLKMHFQYYRKAGDVPGSTIFPLVGASQYEHNFALDFSGRESLRWGLAEYKLYGQSLENHYNSFDRDKHQTQVYGADVAFLLPLGTHEVLVGGVYRLQDIESTITGTHSMQSGGVYLQDSWQVNQVWHLVTGLRWDQSNAFSSPLSPRVNLVYNYNDHLTFKTGYGKAFRAPTANDLYWDQPAYGMTGNPDLKPEEGERFDLSGQWQDESQKLTVNLFRSMVSNGIRWDDPEGDFTYTVVNFDRLRLNGLTIAWQKNWNSFLQSKVRYQYLDQKSYEAATGDYTLAKNYFGQQDITLGINGTYGAFQSGLTWHLVSGRSPQGFTEMPDYQLWNAHLAYRYGNNWQLVLGVNNLLNDSYVIHNGYPMPGREVKLAVEYEF